MMLLQFLRNSNCKMGRTEMFFEHCRLRHPLTLAWFPAGRSRLKKRKERFEDVCFEIPETLEIIYKDLGG